MIIALTSKQMKDLSFRKLSSMKSFVLISNFLEILKCHTFTLIFLIVYGNHTILNSIFKRTFEIKRIMYTFKIILISFSHTTLPTLNLKLKTSQLEIVPNLKFLQNYPLMKGKCWGTSLLVVRAGFKPKFYSVSLHTSSLSWLIINTLPTW